ncbi:hypothetical protein LPJ53_001316 [Coemansia erecta]|uniref:PhoD-like phosphatase domain-containing protein n=1 Tax=Coemansia erecta TaxID=147472 RepID=A0A9W7Y3Q2_9FUNG|nr:hypothetical protein LPJ53_001316 [Coemansia erecta]
MNQQAPPGGPQQQQQPQQQQTGDGGAFSPTNPFSNMNDGSIASGQSPPPQQQQHQQAGSMYPASSGIVYTSSPVAASSDDMAARLANLQLNSAAAGGNQQQSPLHQQQQPPNSSAGYAAGYGGVVTSGQLTQAGSVPPHSSPAQVTMQTTRQASAGGSFAPGYGPPPPAAAPAAQQMLQQPGGPPYQTSASPPPLGQQPSQPQAQPQPPQMFQQQQQQPLVLPPMLGPMLQFVDVELETAEWHGSVLVLTNESLLPHPVQPPAATGGSSGMHAGPSSMQASNLHVPVVEVWDDGVHGPGTGKPKTFTMQAIYTEPTFKYTFWRADLKLALPQESEVDVVYQVHWGADEAAIQSYSARPTYGFRLPAQASQWRMCTTSNLQFTRRVAEATRATLRGSGPVLKDLLAKHRANPFHVWLGTGGQFNGEGVWDDCEHALRPFLLHGMDLNRRAHVPWTADMSAAVERWYFLEYLRQWFGVGPLGPSEVEGQACIKQAVETIPYSFTPDSDILPELGSYVPALHFSHVMGGVKHVGSKYFALFQAHTTPTLAHNEHGFLAEGFHSLKKLGPYTAILTIDTRSERQPAGVVDRHSYDMLFSEVEARVPATATNLIVVSANPVIFPRTRSFEPILRGAATTGLAQIISYAVGSGGGGGAGKQTRNEWMAKDRFGESVAVTRLNDYWTAASHKSERLFVVRSLQEFSRRRSVRVTFASGHVNCLSAGHFRTYTDAKFDARRYPEQRGFVSDYRSMIQLTVSGAVQEPADGLTLRAYHFAGRSSSFDMFTEEKLYHTFNVDVNHLPPPNNNQKLLGRRSYGILIEHDFDNDRQRPGLLSFFYVENESCTGTATPYIINIPPLRYPQLPMAAGSFNNNNNNNGPAGVAGQQARPTLRPSMSYRSYAPAGAAAVAGGAALGGAAAGLPGTAEEVEKQEAYGAGQVDPYALDLPGYDMGARPGGLSTSPPPYSPVQQEMMQGAAGSLPARTDGTYSSSYEHTAAWVQGSTSHTTGSDTGGPSRHPSAVSQPAVSQAAVSQTQYSQAAVSQPMTSQVQYSQAQYSQAMVSQAQYSQPQYSQALPPQSQSQSQQQPPPTSSPLQQQQQQQPYGQQPQQQQQY